VVEEEDIKLHSKHHHQQRRSIHHLAMRCRRFIECLMKIVMVLIVTIVILIFQLVEAFIIAGQMK